MRITWRTMSYIGIGLLITIMGHYGGWGDNIFSSSVQLETNISQPIISELSVFKTKLRVWRNRQRVWQVEAEQIVESAGGNIIDFKNVNQGIIFSVEGQKVFFNADWARWEKLRGELVMGGRVEVNIEDKVFRTEELVMQYNIETLVCSHEITVQGNEVTMKAGKMNLDLKNEILKLDKISEFIQKGNSIRAKGIHYNLKNGQFELVEPQGVTLNL